MALFLDSPWKYQWRSLGKLSGLTSPSAQETSSTGRFFCLNHIPDKHGHTTVHILQRGLWFSYQKGHIFQQNFIHWETLPGDTDLIVRQHGNICIIHNLQPEWKFVTRNCKHINRREAFHKGQLHRSWSEVTINVSASADSILSPGDLGAAFSSSDLISFGTALGNLH